MPLYHKRLLPEPLRTFDSSTFTGSYQAIGTPLVHASTMMLWVNNSGVIVTVSFDGTNAAFVLLPGAAFTFDENANAVTNAEWKTSQGTQFYVSGSASTGLVYFSTFYSF